MLKLRKLARRPWPWLVFIKVGHSALKNWSKCAKVRTFFCTLFGPIIIRIDWFLRSAKDPGQWKIEPIDEIKSSVDFSLWGADRAITLFVRTICIALFLFIFRAPCRSTESQSLLLSLIKFIIQYVHNDAGMHCRTVSCIRGKITLGEFFFLIVLYHMKSCNCACYILRSFQAWSINLVW